MSVRDELFTDEGDRFWLLAEGRSADEAVRLVAQAAGPFEDYVELELVRGHVTHTSHGPYLAVTDDVEHDLEFWQVDAA